MKYQKTMAFMLSAAASLSMTACKWGDIEREERRALGENETRFGDYDSDRDGFLNADEINRYKPDYTRNFDTIDVDRDNQVSEEELRIYSSRGD